MKKLYIILSVLLTAMVSLPAQADEFDELITEPIAPDGVFIKKTVTPSDTDPSKYTIKLESFVTGATTTTYTTTPVDLMLVLDVSTSMAANCQGRPADWTLKNFVPLTTGDKISTVLHTNTSGDSNYAAVENNSTLRYRIKIGMTTYNLLYHNGRWYYGNRTAWSTSKTNPWTEYTSNSKDDIIYTDVKIDLLQEACRVFLDELKVNALGKDGVKGTADDIDIRVGISTYCGQLKTANNYNIVPVTNDANYNALIGKINNLHNNMGGSTDPSLSFDDVKNNKYPTLTNTLKGEGKSDKEISERSKVVVMFTDGKPQDGTHGNDLNYLINSAHNLKALGAKVYTIGIFDDSKAVINNNVTIEQYMSYLSSEYPNATGYSNTARGQKNTDGVTYYYEDTGAKLSEIFKSIAHNAGSAAYKLTASSTVVLDAMSTFFRLPEDLSTTGDLTVEVKTADLTGIDGYTAGQPFNSADYDRDDYQFSTTETTLTGASININQETKEVSVSGFDFSINYCGMHPKAGDDSQTELRGKKLIIYIPIEVDPENRGGAIMATNAPNSGIYQRNEETGELENIAQFNQPVLPLPNIIIRSVGLKNGESASYTIYKLKTTEVRNGDDYQFDTYADLNADGSFNIDTRFTPIHVINLQPGDYGVVSTKIKLNQEGRYLVVEDGWAYTYDLEVTKDYSANTDNRQGDANTTKLYTKSGATGTVTTNTKSANAIVRTLCQGTESDINSDPRETAPFFGKGTYFNFIYTKKDLYTKQNGNYFVGEDGIINWKTEATPTGPTEPVGPQEE